MNFKIANSRVTIPNSWHSVSLGQLLAIREGVSLSNLEVLAIFSNQPVSFWHTVKAEDVATKVLPCLDWSEEDFDWNALEVPEWLLIKNDFKHLWFSKSLSVPMNLDLESYGQKVYISSLIGNKMADSERVPLVLAAYFEPIYSGLPFNTGRLEEFLPVILATSCTEALPIYNFFFRKFSALIISMAG